VDASASTARVFTIPASRVRATLIARSSMERSCGFPARMTRSHLRTPRSICRRDAHAGSRATLLDVTKTDAAILPRIVAIGDSTRTRSYSRGGNRGLARDALELRRHSAGSNGACC